MKKAKASSAPAAASTKASRRRAAATVDQQSQAAEGTDGLDEMFAAVLESAVFELPPMKELIEEAWQEYQEEVIKKLEKVSRNADFEVIHALMLYFYNRRPVVGRRLELPGPVMPEKTARVIERRMREVLGVAPDYKTIHDNFCVAPDGAKRIARRLRCRQMMLAFFAQSCGAMNPAVKSSVSHQELDRARLALEWWSIKLSNAEIGRHLAQAQAVLESEVERRANRRAKKSEISSKTS